MEFGGGEIVIIVVVGVLVLLLALVTIAIPVWAVIDIAQKPDRAWARTDRSRVNWLLAIILTWFIGLGIVGTIVAVVYLAGPRQELNRALREG
jgi:uncharacterized BrkB/YihY/UPF0761 family membrane protein